LYKSKASSISIEFAGEKLRIVIKFPEKVQKIETEVL